LLQTAVIGVFASMDLFLFYLFFEVSLVPMYFLIGIWGGENRLYAAIKFFLYTLVGSVVMLLGVLKMYFLTQDASITGKITAEGIRLVAGNQQTVELVSRTLDAAAHYSGGATGTFNIIYMQAMGPWLPTGTLQILLFAAFALGFAIKVPMFPFHTWLPDAHVEAPTAGSVILAGILLKLGTYGFYRFNLPMFPWASRDQSSFANGAFGVRSVVVFLAIGLTRNPDDLPSALLDKPAPTFRLPQLKDPAKTFSADDMRGLGAYFETQKPAPRAARDAGLAKLGQAIYRGGILAKNVAACTACRSATRT